MKTESTDLVTYAVEEVSTGYGAGYLAIGFVDRYFPPVRPRDFLLEERATINARHYRRGNLKGTALFVLSGSRRYAIERLRKLAGGRRLKRIARETLLQLPRGIR